MGREGFFPEKKEGSQLDRRDQGLSGLLSSFERLSVEHKYIILRSLDELRKTSETDPREALKHAMELVSFYRNLTGGVSESDGSYRQDTGRRLTDRGRLEADEQAEVLREILDGFDKYFDLEEGLDKTDPDELQKKGWESKKELRAGKGRRPQKPSPRQLEEKGGRTPKKMRERRWPHKGARRNN